MSKHKQKITLTSLFTLGISLILILLTLIFATVSLKSVSNLGHAAIAVFKKNTIKDSFMFFNATTYRATRHYSTYFEAMGDFTAFFANQVSEVINCTTLNIDQYPDIFKLSKKQGNAFYTNSSAKNVTAVFLGTENDFSEKSKIINSLGSLMPFMEILFKRNENYLANVWLYGVNDFYLSYPANSAIEKTPKMIDLIKSNFISLNKAVNKKMVFDKYYKVFWTHPYIDSVTGKKVISTYTPVLDEQNNVKAIVGIDIIFKSLIDYMLSSNMLNRLEGRGDKINNKLIEKLDGFIFVVDSDMNVVAFSENHSANLFGLTKDLLSNAYLHKNSKNNLKDSSNIQVKELAEYMTNTERGIKVLKLEDKKYIVTFSKIRAINWTMGFVALEKNLLKSIPETRIEIEKTENKMRIMFISIILGFLAVSVFLTIMFFRYLFLSPIEKILKDIKKMGNGDFNLKLQEKGVAEIYELSVAFNLLGEELNNYTNNLKAEVSARQAAETEIHIAAQMQKTILPKYFDNFTTDKFVLFAKLIPAQNISGDFFDYFYLDENRIGLLVADVAGKGLSAAFYMAMSKVIIKNIAIKNKDNPGNVLSEANKVLSRDNEAGMFVTVFIAFYDINTGELEYANAGHHEAVLTTDAGVCKKFGLMKNIAIGYLDDVDYSSSKINIEIGSTITLCTDGILESVSPSGEEYGIERFMDVISKNNKSNIEELSANVIQNVKSFETEGQFDDITVLMLRRKE